MNRTILHLDLDAFYCAVEEKHNPTLSGKAFAVGGAAEGRGVVSSCSYEARRFEVRSAMPMGQARALCPHLICLPTNFPAYRAAPAQLMERLHAVTPLVEQISIDEAFLDVTALGEPGSSIARRLQAEVRDDLHLSCFLGIAANKLVAKIATDVGKGRVNTGQSPQAICEVPHGTEADFLAPLPASALWGVGPKMAERLSEMGIQTIGDIAQWSADDLRRRFGKHGDLLSRHCLGLDDRAVVTERATKSISRENTFSRNVQGAAALQQELSDQVHQVCRQLRQEGLCAGTVKLKLRWSDFVTVTRQTSLRSATQDPQVVGRMARKLLAEAWHLSQGVRASQAVRLIGVGVSSLDAAAATGSVGYPACGRRRTTAGAVVKRVPVAHHGLPALYQNGSAGFVLPGRSKGGRDRSNGSNSHRGNGSNSHRGGNSDVRNKHAG